LFQAAALRRRCNRLSSARPLASETIAPGSGTTRMSASFACAETRRHGPCAGFGGGLIPTCVTEYGADSTRARHR
jgi:hypothetical protein